MRIHTNQQFSIGREHAHILPYTTRVTSLTYDIRVRRSFMVRHAGGVKVAQMGMTIGIFAKDYTNGGRHARSQMVSENNLALALRAERRLRVATVK
jgi:hypothetical protein